MQDNNNRKKTCGVYTIKGVTGKSSVKISHMDTVTLDEDQKLSDTCLDTFRIKKFVEGEIFACNITNHYLMSTRKQPVMYINVRWNKYFTKPVLYKLYLYFTIESEVKSSEEFLTKPLSGKYSLEIKIGDKVKELDAKIGEFPGEEEVIHLLKNFTLTGEMVGVVNDIISEEEKRRHDMFAKDFEQYKEVPKPTVKLEDYL